MPFNGSGVFVRVYNWATDRANGIPVSADRVDTEDTGFATGLSNVICSDGQSTITQNIPFSNKKITGLGAATLRTDAANLGQVQDGLMWWSGVTAGTANAITISPTPAITAYAAGQAFRFQATITNTDATTLAVSGLAAKDLLLIGAQLTAGDIQANATYEVVYDGTAFQLIGAIVPTAPGNFQVTEQATPDMTVQVGAGSLLFDGTLTAVAAQNTSTITAPVSQPRNDLVYIDAKTGVAGVATGDEAPSPTDPTIPTTAILIARLRLLTTTTTITNSIIDDLRTAFQEKPNSSPAPIINIRQTVLSASVDSGGLPNYLSTGSGLTPSVDGSAVPVILTAADGFGIGGQVDLVGAISAAVSFPAVTGAKAISTITNSTTTATLTTSSAHGLSTGMIVTISGATAAAYNGTYAVTVTSGTTFTYVMASNPGGSATVVGSYTLTNYLYGDIASDGTVTLGSTILQPVYQAGGSFSTVNGQFTFNINQMTGKVGNGSTADQTYRVFIGEAQAGVSSISSVTSYALMGRYDSGYTNGWPTTATKTVLNHNIGISPRDKQVVAKNITAELGYTVGQEIAAPLTSPVTQVSWPLALPSDRLTVSFTTGANASINQLNNATGAAVTVLTPANWAYRITANRGW